MSNSLVFLLITIIVCGCSKTPKVEDLRWMVGTWEQRKGNQHTSETWAYYAANEALIGNSVIVQHGAEVFSEELSIVDSQGVIVYVALLPFKTALFSLDSIGQGYARFINPSNDFPYSIAYLRKETKLEITLTGIQNETHVREVLSFNLVGE